MEIKITNALTKGQLDSLANKPVDLSFWAYDWRADKDVQDSAEAYFIPHRLDRLDKVYRTALPTLGEEQVKSIHYNQPDMLEQQLPPPQGELLAGLLWVGGITQYSLQLHWPEGAAIPSPKDIEARSYPTAWGWFGWTVDKILDGPEISRDGRVWTYRPKDGQKMDFAYSTRVPTATEMVAVFAKGKCAVPKLSVTGGSLGVWESLEINVEWGVRGKGQDFTGKIETHIALANSVLINEDAKNAQLSLLYSPTGRYGVDSRITLYTGDKGGTILVRNIKEGPVYIPELGLFVSDAHAGMTAMQYIAQLEADGGKSIRQLTREHKEASSWEEVLQNVRLWRCPEGTQVPAFPETNKPAVIFDIPDKRWEGMYRAAIDQLRGKHMWGTLAAEAGRVSFEMELVGLHNEADRIYDYFLSSPGVKSDGDYSNPTGSLEWATSMRHDMGYSHEGTHCSTGRLLYSMAQRYLLTGDKEWLLKRLARLKQAADWIISERDSYMAHIPNRHKLHIKGLLPPQMLGDYALPACDWRWYYVDNATSLMALTRFADALVNIGDDRAGYYSAQARDFREDLLAVVEREAVLSPVRASRDGSYCSFLPRMAYAGGLLHYGSQTNIPNFAMGISDLFVGALPLADIHSLLDPTHPWITGTINAMEEYGACVSVAQLPDLSHPTADGIIAENSRGGQQSESGHWFWNSFTNLPKISYNANIYLLQDDIPNFLRYFFNAAITMLGSNGKLWEHAHPDTYEPCENPDNGTSGWLVENLRNMLLLEQEGGLWIAKGTPRAWLEQGKMIIVKGAPTYFGCLDYKITSDAANGSISAVIKVPDRSAPPFIKVRLRHPDKAMIRRAKVNGNPCESFDADSEVVVIDNPTGTVNVKVYY